jgi:small subunit ribosomal protein S17
MAKTMTGVVVSDKADKTIVVSISTRLTHPLYKKQYSVDKRLMAHDPSNEAKVGDTVSVVETKPISAKKHFTLSKILAKATVMHEEPEVQEESGK